MISLALCFVLSACVSLPENYPRDESWKVDGNDSSFSAQLAKSETTHPGQSGAFPLGDGIEALAARVLLARAAEQSLDMQYYIWHPDTAGRLLVKELLDAADRGVRIRLLLDDLGVGAENDEGFLLLEAYRNVSVHLFNPIASRNSRLAGMIADPMRINRRMHNKSMTADNLLTVVGGRNIGDEYFSLSELVNFADMDVLAVGPVVEQVSDSFDIFWNSPASIPVSAFHGEIPSAEEQARARAKLDDFVAENAGPYYEAMEAVRFPIGMALKNSDIYWGKITALFDQPEKALGKETDLLANQLRGFFGKVQEELLIVSPYFVPGKKGTETLIATAGRGVQVRVFTNSLAATDVGAVHAGYKKYRRKLLEGGVEIFEMMPQSSGNSETGRKSTFSGSSGSSLHAKMFIFDQQRVFIGSMNLDPRSVAINTEIGLLIDSADLAEDLESNLVGELEARYYALALEPKNSNKPGGSQRLVWLEHRDGEVIRYTKEPNTTAWQRFKIGLIGLLPIESQL